MIVRGFCRGEVSSSALLRSRATMELDGQRCKQHCNYYYKTPTLKHEIKLVRTQKRQRNVLHMTYFHMRMYFLCRYTFYVMYCSSTCPLLYSVTTASYFLSL